MNNLLDISENKKIIKQFARLDKAKRLAHAYLFSGPQDSGKAQSAYAIAQYFNCEDPSDMPCQTCPSCIKIKSMNHPDIHIIDNGPGESIKISQIRNFLEQVRLRPYLAKIKVFIIRYVDQLTLESANSLLKTLEEPSKQTLIFLTTATPEKVLPTIKSRCHEVYFPAPSKDELMSVLSKSTNLTSKELDYIAYFSEGCLGRAKRLIESDIIEWRDDVINNFLLKPAADDYIKQMTADKEGTKVYLDILFSWIRDAILIKANVNDDRLIHQEHIQDLKQFVLRRSFEELNELLKQITHTQKLLAENLNIKFSLLIIKEYLWARS